MLPFALPELFIEAEPEVPVVPVLPLAFNELLPEVEPLPEVPEVLLPDVLLEVEPDTPETLSVVVG